MPLTWPVAAATGVGSLPGTDPLDAARTIAGELPLPHIPELPERGPGADLLGRGATFLTDLHVDLQPSGWRFVARPGVDERRARDHLSRDLDAIETAYDGYHGVLKVQAAGPWTLAAGIELHRGDRALADLGAVRDIAAALADGLAAHAAEVARRLPGTTVVVQLDEPSLPYVLAGRITSASGFGTLRTPDEPTAVDILRAAIPANVPTGVHSCADDVPFGLLGRSGVAFVSFDLSLLRTRQYDALAELVDDGVHLLVGTESTAPVQALWRNLSHPPDMLLSRVTVTPACGLAGRSPDEARAALARVREVAKRLEDEQ